MYFNFIKQHIHFIYINTVNMDKYTTCDITVDLFNC
jgi:hypothetical protein